jgi:hypothetical protein
MMHADRTNRIVLTVFGLLLLGVGVAAILASTDVYAPGFGNRTLLANPAGHFIQTNNDWFWPALGGLALVVLVFAIWWVIAIIRAEPRTGDIHILSADAPTGRTDLDASALRDALASEIDAYRGVQDARVRILGKPDAPRLAVMVRTTSDADLVALRERLESQALQHARDALDAPDLPIRLDMSVTDRSGDRVA